CRRYWHSRHAPLRSPEARIQPHAPGLSHTARYKSRPRLESDPATMRPSDAPIRPERSEPRNQERCKEKKLAESYREPERKTLVAEQPDAGAAEGRRQAHELRSRLTRER